jgi:hypothetical protein
VARHPDLGRAIRRFEQNSAGNCTEPSVFSNDLSVEEPFDRVRQNRIVVGNHVGRIREMHSSPLGRQISIRVLVYRLKPPTSRI